MEGNVRFILGSGTYQVIHPVRTFGLLALVRFAGWSVEPDGFDGGVSGSVNGDPDGSYIAVVQGVWLSRAIDIMPKEDLVGDFVLQNATTICCVCQLTEPDWKYEEQGPAFIILPGEVRGGTGAASGLLPWLLFSTYVGVG
jgi:hypothetical protein